MRILGSLNAKGKKARKAVGRISIEFMQQVDHWSKNHCYMKNGTRIQLTKKELDYINEFVEEVLDYRMITTYNLKNYSGWPSIN